MMRSLTLALLLGSVSVPVVAQTPDANTQAILDALKGINTRLDTIEQRIDKVEGQETSAVQASPSSTDQTAAPNVAAAAPDEVDPSAPPPGMIIQPGWLVGAISYPNIDSRDPDFFFPLASGKTTFNAHSASSNSTNWYAYQGEAKFNAFKDGKYNFSIQIEPPKDVTDAAYSSVWCSSEFSIDGRSIFAFPDDKSKERISMRPGANRLFSGSVDLTEGNYDVSFFLACFPKDNFDNGPLERNQYYNRADALWRKSSLSVFVRTPSDMSPRPFTNTELFYYAPKESAAQSRGSNVTAGDIRSVKSSLNVRRTASTNAPITAQLAAGDTFKVVDLTSNQEWAEVSMNDRKLGFVKVTALNANSQ